MTHNGLYHLQSEWQTNKRILLTRVVHCVFVCVTQRDLSSRGILTGVSPEKGRTGRRLRVANLGGQRDRTQCDMSPAICSSINYGCIYTPPDSLCAPCGDKDVAISEGDEGARSGSGGMGESLHSLKPERDLSMLYGLIHASVRHREFEPFTEQLLPLGTAVKVKVSPTNTHTHTNLSLSTNTQTCAAELLCRRNDQPASC